MPFHQRTVSQLDAKEDEEGGSAPPSLVHGAGSGNGCIASQSVLVAAKTATSNVDNYCDRRTVGATGSG